MTANTETTTPPVISGLDWIKQIPSSLLKLDDVPLLGHPPAFPWEEFTGILTKLFEVENLSIKPSIPDWKAPEKFLDSLGQSSISSFFKIPSMEGNVCWIISETDLSNLLSVILFKQNNPPQTLDSDFKEGFYNFLIVEILNAFSQVNFDKSLKPIVDPKGTLPTDPALCIDLPISIGSTSVFARLILSPAFYISLKERFAHRTLSAPFNSPLAQKITVTMNLEAGRVNMNLSEWSKIVPGDFLILDNCSLEAPFDKGRIILTVNGIPFFRGKIKEGNIKILEYPLHHEVEMAPKDPDDNEIEEFEDSNLDSDLDDEDTDEEDFSDFDENGEFTEVSEYDHHTEEQELPKPLPKNKTSTITEEDHLPEEKQNLQTDEQKPSTAQDIPLSIVVEVGRVQVTVQKLMELKPGNLLELNVHPENGIDLVVNSKCIGKGELVRIGELLGVRILDIG